MNSKEYLKQIATTKVIDCTYNDKTKKRIADIFPVGIAIIEKDLEVLEILKKKGVAVGFIQLQITENCGGFIEYNDYIGEDKSLHLTADEYEEIKDLLENE